ncbi:hypothetical protein [Streptomyces sp. BK239]|uniref:hypothetical protein n=1 Tax=Streptomyces sp. BK239 TaxID=2512155 RepID=UPI00102C4C67|nr:hypothetical protein [Streptomyces sp. BK239]RZU18330.1 hypothetical protein EV567_3267 [Streptomyces sp. BK239]
MLLVAATTDSPTDSSVAYTHLSVPMAGPALVLDEPTLRRQLWHGPDSGRPKQAAPGVINVPLWACHIDQSTSEAVFFVTVEWRPDAVVLAAFHRTTAPADASGDFTAWACAIADERAAVNFPLPRPGHRSGQGPEAEEKITLTVPANPAAVARLLRDHLPATGAPVFGLSIHRRVLRSDIFLPPGTGRREYAALTPRSDGTWWAKAKVLKDGRLHKSIRPAATREKALAHAAEVLGHPRLVHIGSLHRATWDLPSPTDADGHWSTVTVDTTALAPHPGTLQQVEIEYGACFTAAPVTATASRIRQSVAETADTVAAVLTTHHIPHSRNGRSKIEYFLAAGAADARD